MKICRYSEGDDKENYYGFGGDDDATRIRPGELKETTTISGIDFCGVVIARMEEAAVRSILCEASDIPPFPYEVDDMRVAHMVALIREGFPFEINTWRGGVKASNAKQWKGGNGPDRLGDSEGKHGQASTNDGHGLGGGHGLTLDVPNLVQCLANELQARAGPLLGIIKTHITQEMVALKKEVLVPLRMPAAGGTADLGKGSVLYINLLIFEDTSV
ncbi:unnamed protein product [Brassica rapa subsp. trilocularis]